MSTLKPLELSLLSDIDTIRYNEKGWVLAIIQDGLEGTVLTWVWMNAEALEKTIASQQVWSCQDAGIVLWNAEIKSANTANMQLLGTFYYEEIYKILNTNII